METTKLFPGSIHRKHIIYTVLLVAALSWPWIFAVTTGSVREADLVDLFCLGTIPAAFISVFIVYKERKSYPATYSWGFYLALGATLLLAWFTGAVGIYGRSGAPADLPFYGVIALGVIGGLFSSFSPGGMAGTLAAMAIAQILVSLSGLIAGLGSLPILNGFFTAIWLGSALLFLNASQGQSEPDTLNQ